MAARVSKEGHVAFGGWGGGGVGQYWTSLGEEAPLIIITSEPFVCLQEYTITKGQAGACKCLKYLHQRCRYYYYAEGCQVGVLRVGMYT